MRRVEGHGAPNVILFRRKGQVVALPYCRESVTAAAWKVILENCFVLEQAERERAKQRGRKKKT